MSRKSSGCPCKLQLKSGKPPKPDSCKCKKGCSNDCGCDDGSAICDFSSVGCDDFSSLCPDTHPCCESSSASSCTPSSSSCTSEATLTPACSTPSSSSCTSSSASKSCHGCGKSGGCGCDDGSECSFSSVSDCDTFSDLCRDTSPCCSDSESGHCSVNFSAKAPKLAKAKKLTKTAKTPKKAAKTTLIPVKKSAIPAAVPVQMPVAPASKAEESTQIKKFTVTMGPKSAHHLNRLIAGEQALYINGKAGPLLHLTRGKTVCFQVNLPQGAGLILTTHPAGGADAKPIAGTVASGPNNTFMVKIDQKTPRYFYYQSSTGDFLGGLCLVNDQ